MLNIKHKHGIKSSISFIHLTNWISSQFCNELYLFSDEIESKSSSNILHPINWVIVLSSQKTLSFFHKPQRERERGYLSEQEVETPPSKFPPPAAAAIASSPIRSDWFAREQSSSNWELGQNWGAETGKETSSIGVGLGLHRDIYWVERYKSNGFGFEVSKSKPKPTVTDRVKLSRVRAHSIPNALGA